MTVGIFEHLRWWLNWWMEGRICWVVGKAESLGGVGEMADGE